MERINTSTKSVDLFGSGKHGFTEGDAATGIGATDLSEDWFNDVQEEIATVIENSGAVLSSDNGQLDKSLRQILSEMSAHNLTSHDLTVYTGAALGLAYGNGVWVVVGGSGEIQTSPAGVTWTQRTAAGAYSGTFRAMCYDDNNDLFVAVGSSGEIQTSPDGVTWTARTAAGAYSGIFQSACYGGGYFVAVGASSEIQTSPDGVTWTARTAASTGNWTGVAYDARLNMYVATGDDTVSASIIDYAETTPVIWSARTSIPSVATDWEGHCVFSNGQGLFVMGFGSFTTSGDGIAYSRDGKNWTQIKSVVTDYISSVNYADNHWLLGGNGKVLKSLSLELI